MSRRTVCTPTGVVNRCSLRNTLVFHRQADRPGELLLGGEDFTVRVASNLSHVIAQQPHGLGVMANVVEVSLRIQRRTA